MSVLGYGWAGLLRKYVVGPAHMWWPSTLVQVSLFRALHEKDERRMSRTKFFVIALVCSFVWYAVPGYLFTTLTSVSWVCWTFSKSVTAQQLGSGMSGLGLGAFSLDWSTVASFLSSPLICPFFAIVNVFVGYVLTIYMAIPFAYWGLNLYNAKTFPIFSSHLFTATGEAYNITAIVNSKFEIDMPKEIYERFRLSCKGKMDIHTRLMKRYPDIPNWWFNVLLAATVVVSLLLCTVLKDEVQMPWWGLLFACVLAFVFTLPISIITATTNQAPGLNIITEYVMGIILPGKPIANVCFKTYGYISMAQAVSFLADFKLGHYMKIPPRSMFLVQFIGTIVAGTINIGVAWWLLASVENIFGPRRMFGPLGNYAALNWFFLGGAVGPILVWLLHKAFPKQSWIPLINLPVLLGATSYMPPATTVNYNSWILVGTFFNFFVFRYRKNAGVAFMAVLLYFAVTMEDRNLDWWGTRGEHCELAECPTAKGVIVDGCPVY
ncbi:hypothetical protein C5167_027834 [Papaver somniferum]|nr:hypothetical protein C5167_027834 [Papaver somniferum]